MSSNNLKYKIFHRDEGQRCINIENHNHFIETQAQIKEVFRKIQMNIIKTNTATRDAVLAELRGFLHREE